MEYVKLNNGVEMPILGFGVYQIPKEETKECVLNAIKVGYRLIDTAQSYFNESEVGDAITECGVPREELFITTKVWIDNYGYDKCKASNLESLKKLKTDYIDLVLLHQPFSDYYGAYRALEDLYQEGKIRAIGVSNFYPDRLADICLFERKIIPAVNQVETNPFNQQIKAQENMEKYGVHIEAWAPFGEGKSGMFTNEVLKKIGEKYHKSVAQVILRWLIQRGVIVVCKSTHVERMKENFDVFDFELSHEDNMPTETIYLENNGSYFDDPGFRPYLSVYEVPEGVEVKGAVLISPGGAFMFRSENQEGSSVARSFAENGYLAFVVHYRVRPYTEEESGIDIARAIKYVRCHASDYGIPEDNISVVGFSAGGIANGHAVLEFGNTIDGTILDSSYVPDEIDKVSLTPNAVIMGYSFYGRLSVAGLSESTFRDFSLPPTYYVYGTEDPFYSQFNRQVDLLQSLNKNIQVQVLDHYPHGFGATGEWIDDVCRWLEDI